MFGVLQCGVVEGGAHGCRAFGCHGLDRIKPERVEQGDGVVVVLCKQLRCLHGPVVLRLGKDSEKVGEQQCLSYSAWAWRQNQIKTCLFANSY